MTSIDTSNLYTLQHNREGTVTVFEYTTNNWVGVFTCESHALRFVRLVLRGEVEQ